MIKLILFFIFIIKSACGSEMSLLLLSKKDTGSTQMHIIKLNEKRSHELDNYDSFEIDKNIEQQIEASGKALEIEEHEMYMRNNAEESKPQKALYKIKISEDENDYIVLALKINNKYNIYIVSNDILEQILFSVENGEFESIAQAVSNDAIEIPKIPLPPVLTRIIVNFGVYAILAYHFIKDSIKTILNQNQDEQ